jgi:hypothetical protein
VRYGTVREIKMRILPYSYSLIPLTLRRRRVMRGLPIVCIALLLAACMPADAQTGTKAGDLYLLAGTPTSLQGTSYPVTLYNADSHQKLKLVRQIVAPTPWMEGETRGGVAAVLDDMIGRIYVVFPAPRASTVSIIHKGQPTVDDQVTFEPRLVNGYGPGVGLSAGALGASYLLLAGTEEEAGSNDFRSVDTLMVVAGDAPAQGNRVIQDDYARAVSTPCLYPCPAFKESAAQTEWRKYQSFRFEGSPGGPTAPGFTPNGKTLADHVVIGGPQGSWIPLDSTPPGFPVEKKPPGNPTIVIVAATERFFAFTVTPAGYTSLGLPPSGVESVYVHDRKLNTWKEIKSAATVPVGRRIFGSWLATIVEVIIRGEGSPDNPGRENERSYQTDSLPNIRDLYSEFAAKEISIPGTLLLDNLEDGRRIRIDTGQEDSEILDVRDDGLVLYRVNDSVFAAQIAGDKLGKPSLVVKDEDVPEVHWVFWSHSEAPRANTQPLSPVTLSPADFDTFDADQIDAAAAEGDTNKVQQLLQDWAHIGPRQQDGTQTLLLAVHFGNAKVVKLLLDKGVNDIELKDRYGSTALLLAAESGNAAVVRLLLDKGANIGARNQYGSTPLLRAAFNGHAEVVKLLLEKHANIQVRDNGGRTALALAVDQGNTEIVNLLREKGAQ